MPVLHCLPWCRIDGQYVVGNIVLSPLDTSQLSVIDASVRADAAGELDRIIDITGRPVSLITVARFFNKDLLADFSPMEMQEYIEAVDLICFTALSGRDFLGRMIRNRMGLADGVEHGERFEHFASAAITIAMPSSQDNYCNADCFQPFGLPLANSAAKLTYFVGTNRRDHHSIESFASGSVRSTVPTHVNSLIRADVSIAADKKLLQALISLRKSCMNATTSKRWDDWYDGIENFNQANSDNPAVRWQTEWVLMCGAFRRVLLEDQYKAAAVADAFAVAFLPRDGTLSKLENCESLLRKWLYDFHTPRHDFGHGKQVGSTYKPNQPGPWLPIGNLLIAAILFPLLIRALLFREGHYTLTNSDRCQYAAAVELMRRFPSNEYAPAADVRKIWMEFVNAEWGKLKTGIAFGVYR